MIKIASVYFGNKLSPSLTYLVPSMVLFENVWLCMLLDVQADAPVRLSPCTRQLRVNVHLKTSVSIDCWI
jgi:hypothetical protein